MHTTSRLGIVVLLLLFPVSVPAAPPKTDAFGDPLPPHALARLGTARFRALHEIEAVALSPDGKVLAVADGDDLALYDAASGKRLRTLATVKSLGSKVLHFRNGGRQLLSAGYKGVRVWDTTSGKVVAQWLEEEFEGPVAVSADGRRFAVSCFSTDKPKPVIVRDLSPRREVGRVTPPQNDRLWMALSPDGTTLATGGNHLGDKAEELRNLVQVWDVASGKEKLRLRAASASVQLGCFSADGRLLATAGYEPTVQVWEVATGRQRCRIVPSWFKEEVGVLRLSPDGRRVYAADQLGNVGFWESASGKLISRRGHSVDAPVGVSFLPSGRLVAWGCNGQLLRLWDPVSGKSTTPAGGHLSGMQALGFGADGKILYSLDAEAELLRWNLSSGKESRAVNLQDYLYRKYSVWIHGQAAFAPDGRRLVVPTYACGLVVIDPESGERVKALAEKQARWFYRWQVQ